MIRVMQFNFIILTMSNTLRIGGNDLAYGVLHNNPIRVLISLYIFVRLCNTPLIFKIYVINPKTFLGNLQRGNVISLHLYGHEQYHFNIVGQNELAHGVLHNISMRVMLSI
jgi:hypothetical protein